MSKLNAATKKTLAGTVGLAIMGWVLVMSAYSMYFVARHLEVPQFFAWGMSTVYDGAAIFAAYKSLQYAEQGRSGIMPRLWMAAFVAVSAWCNSLHSILGHESPLAIPMWACLPVVAAAMFELHTSQARARALARLGKKYPAPMPSWGSHNWFLFPLQTLDRFRGVAWGRLCTLAMTEGWEPRKVRKARSRAVVRGHLEELNAPETTVARNSVTSAYRPVSATVTLPSGSGEPGRVSVSVTRPVSHEPVTANAGIREPVTADVDTREPVTGPPAAANDSAPEASTADTRVTEQDTSVSATVADPVSGHVTGSVTGVTHPVSGPVPGTRTLGLARNCEQCGNGFVAKPGAQHARFCTTRCRVAWNRAKKRAEEAS
jgi:hypothetical protein